MSEQLRSSGEQLQPQLDASAEARKNLERIHEEAEKAEKDPLQKHIESLQNRAETEAISGKEIPAAEQHAENQDQSFGITRELKTDAYKKSLKKIRGHLNAPERVFSRVVHQPVIEKTSNGLAKTVARPSAFLGGSLGALLGSSLLVYLSRHYGFKYNYAFIFVTFAAGFAVGLLLEALYKLVARRRSS